MTTENIAVAKLRTGAWEMGVVSVYLEGNKPVEPYLDMIGKAVAGLGTGNVILGGDVNAWNTWWGSRKTDKRGIEVAAKLDEMEFHIINRGTEPTFDTIRGGKRFSSCVDITTCSTSLLGRVDSWRLSEEVTSSDHRAILFDINLEKSISIDIKRTTRKFNTKKANWREFHEKLTQIWQDKQINNIQVDKIYTKEDLEKKIGELTESIVEVCQNSMPQIKNKTRMGLPWWTEELSRRKKEVSRLKRRISYAAPVRRDMVVEQYIQAKQEYQQLVRNAQTTSWKDFCSKQDRESMWDGIYRVIGRTTKRQEDIPLVLNGKTLGNIESARVLAETFYPEDKDQEDDAEHRLIRETAETLNEGSLDDSSDPPFTVEELLWAASSFNPKKAPGNDGLTADICAAAIALDPTLFLAIANKCLDLAYFPVKWKEAAVVVLRKPGKEDYTHPKAYRPIGLLPVLGKIVEKMIIRRVKWYIVPKISKNQYGFMPQRSTEDSLYDMIQLIKNKIKDKKLIVLVSLDIEGAFDNAWWPAIRCRLAETGCPKNLRRLIDSYLHDRSVCVKYSGAEWAKKTTKGCVQGSIGGPIFWNLLLDPLLQELNAKGEYCQAFADDVVLIFSGDKALEVQEQANAALALVQRWGIKNKLKFAPQKTKAMIITNKIKYDSPLLRMGGESIGLTKEIKILGLTVDDGLTFNTHVKNVCCKVQNLYRQLCRAAKVHWGLNSEIVRTIYVAVVEPIILYAASAWAPATNKQMIKKQFDMVQRGFVQKIIKSYRTVSLHSALLLAGLLPLDLRVREAALLYETKKGYSRRVVGDREMEGSIGGPILWNILLDPLLKKLADRGDYCQAFADDVVLVFDGKTAQEVQDRANDTLERVRSWGVENKLNFAPHKTCAMIITRKLKHDTPRLSMGGVAVGMSKEIKLLGMTIDDKLTFNTHVANACRKAINIYKKLSGAAKVSWGLHPEVIKIIYTATVEPVILYAAGAWGSAAEKLMVIKQLQTVQRGIAQKLCKAYRTVSLNSALVLAGILPLDLRVREASSLYEAKRGLPQSVLARREVERMASALETPHPAECLELNIVSLANQDDVKNAVVCDMHIYTDGSKIDGKVGAAVSVWTGGVEAKTLKLALPEYCTVYQAELLAISRATRVIRAHNALTFGIYSDSMAALLTIKNPRCLHPIAVEARENLKDISLQGKVVTLFWIKAHAGFEGNERADQLAKEAAKNSKKKPDYDLCPVSFVKRCIRQATLDEWNHRYKTGETAAVTKMFFPDAVTAYRIVRKIKIDSHKTQVMTGHGGFSEYLNRFKCKESPSCICDPAIPESIPHIVLECPVFGIERFEVESKMKTRITAETVKDIMESDQRNVFLDYCVRIARKVIVRNKSS
ncbi:unnamed protein product [Parnassius mnemosyne]|uniref:115 kDa protein in type-1 retrotransposable element R1DM n=1 Tax=Parnassius mnemosyne TaxID=213953 RepID=A0AAV1L7L7_9NEOP